MTWKKRRPPMSKKQSLGAALLGLEPEKQTTQLFQGKIENRHGRKFRSKAEADRATYLIWLKETGQIKDVIFNTRYYLKAQSESGKVIDFNWYTDDFTIVLNDGRYISEDYKPRLSTNKAQAEYMKGSGWRMQMVLLLYDIEISLVYKTTEPPDESKAYDPSKAPVKKSNKKKKTEQPTLF